MKSLLFLFLLGILKFCSASDISVARTPLEADHFLGDRFFHMRIERRPDLHQLYLEVSKEKNADIVDAKVKTFIEHLDLEKKGMDNDKENIFAVLDQVLDTESSTYLKRLVQLHYTHRIDNLQRIKSIFEIVLKKPISSRSYNIQERGNVFLEFAKTDVQFFETLQNFIQGSIPPKQKRSEFFQRYKECAYMAEFLGQDVLESNRFSFSPDPQDKYLRNWRRELENIDVPDQRRFKIVAAPIDIRAFSFFRARDLLKDWVGTFRESFNAYKSKNGSRDPDIHTREAVMNMFLSSYDQNEDYYPFTEKIRYLEIAVKSIIEGLERYMVENHNLVTDFIKIWKISEQMFKAQEQKQIRRDKPHNSDVWNREKKPATDMKHFLENFGNLFRFGN